MKKYILLLSFIGISWSLHSQAPAAKNIVAIESNFIISLNASYERIHPLSEKVDLTLGADYWLGIGFGYGSHWISPEIGLNIFGPKHSCDIGILYAFELFSETSDREDSPGIRIAYRYMLKNGMLFRANSNFLFNIDPIFIPTIGLGYAF